MGNLSAILSATKKLQAKELRLLSSKILEMLKGDADSEHISQSEVNSCRRCGSSSIIRYGKDKNGKQRYKCKHCNTIFYETSFSVVSKSHYDLSVWEKYVVLLIQGASLCESAKACGISVPTAFSWRHKILHALQIDQGDRLLGGVVEIDDMFFSISYKGNHKNSSYFSMPRKAHKRGGDDKSGIGNRACVLCACERQGQTYGEVMGLGAISANGLKYAFENRLLYDTIALTDKAPSFKQYFSTTTIELVQLQSHSDRYDLKSPPEVRGSYHIQNVNNLHSRIRKAMQKYNGVATKYLNHYINLFIWIENNKRIYKSELCEAMLKSLANWSTYISYRDIIGLPTISQTA